MKAPDPHPEVDELARAVSEMARDLHVGRMYVATPEGREIALTLQRNIRRQLLEVRSTLRQLEKADRTLKKLLGKPWGVAL
mgnify:CR=1 FL=1